MEQPQTAPDFRVLESVGWHGGKLLLAEGHRRRLEATLSELRDSAGWPADAAATAARGMAALQQYGEEHSADSPPLRMLRLETDSNGGLHLNHRDVPLGWRIPAEGPLLRLPAAVGCGEGGFGTEAFPRVSLEVSCRRVDTAAPGSRFFFTHKTTWRDVYAEVHGSRSSPEVFDVVLVNAAGHLTEGTFTNIACYLVGGEGGGSGWFTPPLSDGLLPGVLRQHLLEGGAVEERVLSPEDLLQSPCVVCFNSVRGVAVASVVQQQA